jgi:hypothetical protein
VHYIICKYKNEKVNIPEQSFSSTINRTLAFLVGTNIFMYVSLSKTSFPSDLAEGMSWWCGKRRTSMLRGGGENSCIYVIDRDGGGALGQG